MPIIEKQLKRLIDDASRESLKSGKVLDLSQIASIIQEKVITLKGGPTLNVRRQERRKGVILEALNKMFEEVEFDLDLLYELIQEKYALLLNRFNSTDVSYKAQRSQLNVIDAAVTDLLFTVKDADDNFFGVFDNLSDFNKIDVDVTTDGALDLAESAVVLPFSMPSAIRHDMSHLYNIIDGQITTVSEDGTKTTGKNGAASKFGYAFSDLSSIWRYDVTSASDKGVRLTVTFPLTKENSLAILTRFEVSGISGSGAIIDVRHSLDNENFTRFQSGEPKEIDPKTEKIAWDFPETTCRYIRLIISKSAPDAKFKQSGNNTVVTNPALQAETANPQQGGAQNLTAFGLQKGQEDKWIYSFSIASICAFKLGRSEDAIFQSKPLLSIDAPTIPVSKLSLTVDEQIIPRTSIEYEIALSDKMGTLATEFLPINPTDRIDGIVPKVITFGEDTKDSFDISIHTGTISTGDIVVSRATQYYPIYQLPADRDYRFGSAKLYRGGNVFSSRTNSKEIIKSQSDNYIDFSDGIRTKQLYSFKTETATIINRLVGGGNVLKTFLKLTGPVARSIRVVRDDVSDPPSGLDPEPDYAIANVEHIRPTMVIEGDSIVPTGINTVVNGVSVPVAGSWLGSTTATASIGVPIILNGQPVDIRPSTVVLKYVSTTTQLEHTFREGIDYSVKRSDDSYFLNFPGWNSFPLHWRVVPVEPSSIIINSGSPLTGQYGGTGSFSVLGGQLPPVTLGADSLVSNQLLNIDYEIDPNITHRVVDVSYSSNEIELDTVLQMMPGDTVIVSYRKVPQNIIRDSVAVTSNPGTDNPGNIYKEGRDYSLDLSNGTISMSLGGEINNLPSPVVYVDHSFKESVDETNTYSIWCYYESREPLKFIYNNLNFRNGSNEKLLWTTNGSTKRIDDRNEITLTRGWHQFIVQSLDPDIFNDGAIVKALKFRDIEGRYLFLRIQDGGKIFTKMTAYRSPMRETTFSALKNSVLKTDHSVFAISSANKVFVNFSPAQTSDLYMKKINSSGSIVDQTTEEFRVEAVRRLTVTANSTNPGYVILRARLSRSEESSGGVTPKLFGYNLRIAY